MPLDLVWMAIFRDGAIRYQFDDDAQRQEHPFQEVLERHDELQTFCLLNRKTGSVYQVDLEHGRIRVSRPGSRITEPEAEVEGDPSRRSRLIYFRRMTRQMMVGRYIECVEGVTTAYFLGVEYTTPDGMTARRLLQISGDDEVYVA